MTLNDMIDRYHEYLIVEKGLSLNTIEAYHRDIAQYCDFIENELGIVDLNEVTKEDLHDFIATLYDRNLASKSITRKITAIREFHKFLLINDYLKENLLSYIVNPKEQKKLPEVLSIEEVDRLLNSFDQETDLGFRNKTMVELMYATGLRVSELVHLKIDDLHLKMQVLRCVGKGNKERIVPMGERAIHLVEQYLSDVRPKLNKHYDTQTLFLSQNGQPLTRQDFWQILKDQLKICNLSSKVSPHKLRHSFASHLLQNQADIRYIQELLGHADIATTQIYTHVNTKQLTNVVNLYHPRSRKGSGNNNEI